MTSKLKKIIATSLSLALLFTSTTSANGLSNTKSEVQLEEFPSVITNVTYNLRNEVEYSVEGLSFENNIPYTGSNTIEAPGLSNYMVHFSNAEYNDGSLELNELKIPSFKVMAEGKLRNSDFNLTGMNVVIQGGNSDNLWMFTCDKKITLDDSATKEGSELKVPDIVLDRQEIVNALEAENSKYLEWYNNAVEKDPNTQYDPSKGERRITDVEEYRIYLYPMSESVSNTNAFPLNKLEIDDPIKLNYSVKENISLEEIVDKQFSSYVKWYQESGNSSEHSIFSYSDYLKSNFETSTVTVKSSEPKTLTENEVLNLTFDIKNDSETISNAHLYVGYDLVLPSGKILEQIDEFTLEEGLKPGESTIVERDLVVPADVDGKSITIKPYIYSDFAYSQDGNTWTTDNSGSFLERDYNDNLVIKLSNEEDSGGTGSGPGGSGGGGGSVDPGPNPPAPSKTVILASGEKYTDVLTATVLGNEKDAPILLSQKDSVDEKILAEIKRLNAEDIIISGGTDSVSDKVVDQLKEYNVTRIAGQDRYETAEKIGNEVRKITGNNEGAMLVDGTNFPDVITISSLASQKRVPILLTDSQTLTNTTKKTIESWGVNDVTIGGGYNSVSKDIENNLGVSKVSRFGGVDRYETASLIGNEVRKVSGNKDDMILVDGTNFPDGITINSLASHFKAPIMLTNPEQLNDITANKIKEWSIKNVLIGGGYNSVSKAIEDSLEVNKKERVAGLDRYETAVKISQRLSNGNSIGN